MRAYGSGTEVLIDRDRKYAPFIVDTLVGLVLTSCRGVHFPLRPVPAWPRTATACPISEWADVSLYPRPRLYFRGPHEGTYLAWGGASLGRMACPSSRQFGNGSQQAESFREDEGEEVVPAIARSTRTFVARCQRSRSGRGKPKPLERAAEVDICASDPIRNPETQKS